MTRIVERAVPTTDGQHEVGVRGNLDGRVDVRWRCGDTRSFTADGVKQAIRNLEDLAPFADVRVELRDADGEVFYAQLVDSELRVGMSANEINPGTGVPWKALRRALKKAL